MGAGDNAPAAGGRLEPPPPALGPVAWAPLAVVAALCTAVLMAASGGYGPHRDELYFVLVGGHPDWGYADQPPLAPLLAHAMDRLGGGSLSVLRLPAALAAGATALLTGLIARELGGGRGAQVLAAAAMAGSAILLAVGHLMSTAVLDLLWWVLLSWLLVRALRDGGRWWLGVGLVAGVALQTKTLVLLLLGAMAVGVLVSGPRRVLASPHLWGGVVLALLIWAPNLWWQVDHGLPQLTMSAGIASGSSGTSEPRALIVPYQLVLVSPVLVPVWALGWWRLARAPELATWRSFAAAYLVVLAVVLLTGGKPYYVTGLYAVLLAAGAAPVARWLGRHRSLWVRGGVATAAAVGLAVNAVLFLPLVPVARLADTPVTDVNYDAGEQVGWPAFAGVVGAEYEALPAGEQTVVLTANYGQAGALHRYRPDLPVVSGHNGLWDLGPPPDGTDSVVAVGYSPERLQEWFGDCAPVGTVDNGVGLDNDEQGTEIALCREPVAGWAALWPRLRRLG